MESEWRVYLRENAPELYEQMIKDVRWAAKWRDKRIAELETGQNQTYVEGVDAASKVDHRHKCIVGAHDESGTDEDNAYGFGWRCCALSILTDIKALAGGEGEK